MDRRAFIRRSGAFLAAPPVLGALAGRAGGEGASRLALLLGSAPPDPACHYFYWAAENGFYRQQGVEVAITPIAAETTALRALISGEGDVAWVGAISTLQAMNAGSRVKVMSAFTPRLDYLMIAQRGVAGLKALDNRAIAVTQIGAVSQIVPLLMIETAGGDGQKAKWVSVGGSAARVQALISKRVDAAALNSSFAARTAPYDHLHPIGDAAKDLPDFVYTWEVVTADAVARKRDALKGFAVATAQGIRWAMEHPADAAAISRRLLPDVPGPEITAGIEGFVHKGFFNPSGRLPQAAWDFTVASMRKLGTLRDSPPYADGVLADFTDAVAAAGDGK